MYEGCFSRLDDALFARILRGAGKHFAGVKDIESLRSIVGYRIVPYKVRDPVLTLTTIIQPGKFYKSQLYKDFVEYNQEEPSILVFSFIKRELYVLAPYSDVYNIHCSSVLVFHNDACLLRFREFLQSIPRLQSWSS